MDTEAIQQEAMLYCAGTDSVDSSPKAEPREQRRFTVYTLASRLQKQKAKLNPYVVAYNFTGYFTACPRSSVLVSLSNFLHLHFGPLSSV
jgi:hypothetical protein